jgi:8-oxo-dGTP pyrophosphatase MutT (NUDIX family)
LDSTANDLRPFAAGAVVVRDGRLVLTLNTDDVPDELAGHAFRVGWVGGSIEAGETPWQCVTREAREEIGVAVDRLPPPATKRWDWETRMLADMAAEDGELLQVRTGDGRRAVAYLAAVGGEAPLVPGDDVVGILLLPPRLWPLVEHASSVADAVAAGAELVGGERLPPDAHLWLHPTATLRVAIPLLAS